MTMDRATLDQMSEPGRTTVLRNARLIDGTGAPPRPAAIAVRDGAIVAVGDDMPTADTTIDCARLTLLPGLIDAHAHLVYAGFRSLEEIDRQSVETATINGVRNAAKVLRAGYTTIRDVGTIGNVAVAVRDAVATGKVPGPRVIASGSIICPTAGLGDTTPPHWTRAHGLGVLVDGAEGIRAEVRRQIRAGVDNIKLAASGVEVGPYAWTWMTTFSEEEVRVAVEEAHRWGRTVAVHAQSYDSVKFALRAGVDTIEHGTRMDDEAIALFARSEAVLVPTLSTLFSVLELGASLNLPAKQREEMSVNEPLWLELMRTAPACTMGLSAIAAASQARNLVAKLSAPSKPISRSLTALPMSSRPEKPAHIRRISITDTREAPTPIPRASESPSRRAMPAVKVSRRTPPAMPA